MHPLGYFLHKFIQSQKMSGHLYNPSAHIVTGVCKGILQCCVCEIEQIVTNLKLFAYQCKTQHELA